MHTPNTKVSLPSQMSQQSGVQTAEDCKRECLESASPCFGVEFNKGGRTCVLLLAQNFELDVIAGAVTFDTYHRQFIMEGKTRKCHRTLAQNV